MNAHASLPNQFGEIALSYAQRGWPVFPCNPLTKKPITEKGFYDATTDPTTISTWWAKSPNAMIGCPCGPVSGFWVLDADRDKEVGIDGVSVLAQMGSLPDTVEQVTPRGGQHKFFRWNPNQPVKNSASKFGKSVGKGVDVRGAGGYVILAGSMRADRATYEWSISPENGEIKEAPEWVYDEIRRIQPAPVDTSAIEFPLAVEAVTEGAAKVFNEQCQIVATTESGGRNDVLNKAAFIIGMFVMRGEISAERATEGLLWAAERCGLVDDDGEDSARKTIASGLGSSKRTDPTRHHEDVETPADGSEAPSIFPPGEKPPPQPSLMGTPYDFAPAASIAPREFLYGFHYLRNYVSATIAPTKVGKSSLGIVEALAMCSGKPLLGVKPTGLWRVRIWNGEDPREEMSRRVAAAMIEYGLTREDVGDRLLLDSGRDMPICVAKPGNGTTVIMRPVLGALEAALLGQKVDVLIIDPFVKSHGVSENDNMAVDQVAREWNLVAGRCGVAVDLVHHSRKLNGGEASIDDARGASALVSAARSARVLARMTKKEGDRASRSKDYKRFFRFADAVSNMAISAGDDETWMELKSVDLNNAVFGDDGKIKWPSDQVGVVRLSSVRGALDEEEPTEERAEAEKQALAELSSGDWRQDSQSRDAWAGVAVARAYKLSLDDPDDKTRVKAILKALIKSGKLITETRRGADRHPKTFVKTAPQVVTEAASDLFG